MASHSQRPICPYKTLPHRSPSPDPHHPPLIQFPKPPQHASSSRSFLRLHDNPFFHQTPKTFHHRSFLQPKPRTPTRRHGLHCRIIRRKHHFIRVIRHHPSLLNPQPPPLTQARLQVGNISPAALSYTQMLTTSGRVRIFIYTYLPTCNLFVYVVSPQYPLFKTVFRVICCDDGTTTHGGPLTRKIHRCSKLLSRACPLSSFTACLAPLNLSQTSYRSRPKLKENITRPIQTPGSSPPPPRPHPKTSLSTHPSPNSLSPQWLRLRDSPRYFSTLRHAPLPSNNSPPQI